MFSIPLFLSNLNTHKIGLKIEYLKSTDSTNSTKFKIYENKLSNYSIFKLPIKITLIDKKNQFFNSINSYLNLYNNQ